MKVLLAYPFRQDAYHKLGFILPPMGISYIASALRDNGYEVAVKDFNINTEKVDFKKYDVVGISVDTSRYKSSIKLASEAKNANCTVVAGGPHVTFMDKEALETGVIDYVVRGEGENTMTELLNTLYKNNIDNVDGISFLKNNAVHRTKDREFISDINNLMPARDLMNLKSYSSVEMGKRKITPILTSRGCPFACSFCSSSEMSGRRWRARSAVKVVKEIEDIVKNYGFDGLAFLDDNFTMDPQRVIDICDGIIKKGIDIYWWCFSRADTLLKNEDMVKKMAEAGCRYIFIGFESRHQKNLDTYGKKISENTYNNVVALLKKYKISIHASFIIGEIHETKDMVRDTVKYARELNPEAVQFTILTPYPGTKLFEEVKERIITYDWNLYDCLHSVVRLDYLKQKEIQSLLKKAYISFYLSPKKIIAGILSGVKGKGIRLKSILRIIRGVA
jgi:anaerobic magnesium-protoporphyrin IX monomethyl ester cyclase